MFTNWLTPTPTTAAPPPDVIIEIGPPPFTRFAAHRNLLSAHSGYLRSAIRPDERPIDLPIYLPNITTDQFAPLLTYMYTGYLDLTIDNIFSVLLATHILHMPRALEICRQFLARTQTQGYLCGGAGLIPPITTLPMMSSSSSSSVTIHRPIPSKATILPHRYIVPPISGGILLPHHDTQFKSMSDDRIDTHPSPSRPSTSKIRTTTSPDRIDLTKIDDTSKKSSPSSSSDDTDTEVIITTLEPVKLTETVPQQSKFIIDVASCDGPVRFRRVLNDAYGRYNNPSSATTIEPIDTNRSDVTMSFHQQMAKNIAEQQLRAENDTENSQDDTDRRSDEIFTCVYCKHTFKSQYCYQKHAKRHINPLGDESMERTERDENGSGGKVLSVQPTTHTASVKREVRPLDMNVQYYPCKMCGSKFPSYYFVHKHRKMCHTATD